MKKQKIRWQYLPHKRNNKREEESAINDFRIDKGLTWEKLIQKTKIPFSLLRRLTTGEVSPIYITGKNKNRIKKDVKILIDFFNTSFSELFPRYSCELEKLQLTNIQLNDLLISDYYLNAPNPEVYLLKKELWNYIYIALKSKSKLRVAKKRFLILRLRSLYFTLDDIGKILKITRERIRQLEAKGLKILRQLKLKKELL